MNALGNELAKVAKAIASGIAAFVGTVVLALDLQPADHQGVQYLTQSQWGIILLAVLASYGITWRVPNKTGLPGEEVGTDGTNNDPTAVVPTPVVLPGTGSHVAPTGVSTAVTDVPTAGVDPMPNGKGV